MILSFAGINVNKNAGLIFKSCTFVEINETNAVRSRAICDILQTAAYIIIKGIVNVLQHILRTCPPAFKLQVVLKNLQKTVDKFIGMYYNKICKRSAMALMGSYPVRAFSDFIPAART